MEGEIREYTEKQTVLPCRGFPANKGAAQITNAYTKTLRKRVPHLMCGTLGGATRNRTGE